jgi:hypothetical protein
LGEIVGAIARTCRLKHLLNGAPVKDFPAKRLYKPPQNLLATFDAKHLLANIPKRNIRSKKAILLLIARTLALQAILQV